MEVLNQTLQSTAGRFLSSSVMRGTGVAIGTMITLLSHPVEARVGTAGARTIETRSVCNNLFAPQLEVAEPQPEFIQRSAADNLRLIRTVFSPTMSELALVLGVSRQSLYNWLNGEEPGAEHLSKIADIALAADLFIDEGISLTGNAIKRKVFGGKSFFEVVADGATASNAAATLITLIKKENSQRNSLDQRLAGRLKKINNPSEIGFSAFNDEA